jgi:hypothetical protein
VHQNFSIYTIAYFLPFVPVFIIPVTGYQTSNKS